MLIEICQQEDSFNFIFGRHQEIQKHFENGKYVFINNKQFLLSALI